jgi:hypothetical protein
MIQVGGARCGSRLALAGPALEGGSDGEGHAILVLVHGVAAAVVCVDGVGMVTVEEVQNAAICRCIQVIEKASMLGKYEELGECV